jgi:hypothetical protein
VGFFVAAVALGRDDTTTAMKFVVLGVILSGCGPTLFSWGKFRDRKVALTIREAVLLLLPPALLTLVTIFDIDGIVIGGFRHDILGYWRSSIDEPLVPLVLVPFAALPMYAGIRCLRSTHG